MDNGEVKKFRPRPVKAPQGGEENVLKGLFSQNLRWLRLEDYHRLYIPVLKIGRQWRIPTAGCALSNLKKLTFFFFLPPLSNAAGLQKDLHMDVQKTVFFFFLNVAQTSQRETRCLLTNLARRLCPPPHAAGQMASFSQLVHNE